MGSAIGGATADIGAGRKMLTATQGQSKDTSLYHRQCCDGPRNNSSEELEIRYCIPDPEDWVMEAEAQVINSNNRVV